MLFHISPFLRSSRQSQQINPAGQQHPLSSDPTTEPEGWLRFSLSSLMALFAIIASSGSKVLQLVALTLLMFTISLRLIIDTCFLHDHPTLSRFLHVIPLLGTFCMAGVALVSDLQSPALAAVCLFLGVLPLVTVAIHQGILHAETSAPELPVRMQDVPAPGVSVPVDTAPVSQ